MITPEMIELYKGWEIGAAAAVLCPRYRAIIKNKTALFVEMGLVLMEIERRELWKFDVPSKLDEDSFRSFNDWIHRASGTSNGTAYDALAYAKSLSHIPVEERNEIPRVNQKVLAKLSPAVSGDPEVKKAAKEGSNDELRSKIEREHPLEHLERKEPMRFLPDSSARAVIDETLEMIMAVEECGRDQALEYACEVAKEQYADKYTAYLKERGAVREYGRVKRQSARVQ